jgi:hypothetical protein
VGQMMGGLLLDDPLTGTWWPLTLGLSAAQTAVKRQKLSALCPAQPDRTLLGWPALDLLRACVLETRASLYANRQPNRPQAPETD